LGELADLSAINRIGAPQLVRRFANLLKAAVLSR